MIDQYRVEKIFLDCLFRKEELGNDGQPPQSKMVMVQGIQHKIGFHIDRLKGHEQEIVSFLRELPDQFMADKGGGWTFLNACNTKSGELWTGLHQRMDQLFCLAMALGKAAYCLPREVWSALPGGMPYIVINLK